MQVRQELMTTIADMLRQQGSNITDEVARKAWLNSVEQLEARNLTNNLALHAGLRASDPVTSSLSCWALGHLRDETALNELLSLIRRGDPNAFEAAKAIRNIRSHAAIKPLSDLLTSRSSSAIRSASAYALAAFHCIDVQQRLCDVLRNVSEPAEIRSACAEALGDGNFEGAFEVLVSSTADLSADVRFWSIYALGELGLPAALQTIRPHVHDYARTSTGELVSAEATLVCEMLTEELP
jgi:HEAT repeat protein